MQQSNFQGRVLFEDNHILVVNKKAGELVQPDTNGEESLEDTLKEYIRANTGKTGNIYLGVIHRIDRPVSGAVMFAKSSKALARLNKMIQNREISKTYWAIVCSKPPAKEQTLVHYLKRITTNNTTRVFDHEAKDALRAELRYSFLAASDKYYLLEVNLITGRHHQIRAQLSAMGMCIKGDLKYKAPRSNPDGSISLHARKLEFIHPVTNQNIIITAPVPTDPLWTYFETNAG
ncbi:MAG: RNA pseudouridine synthase [Bacteroidetes bacterium HGW-Bacteroidetes-21]|nr:MAG: RNA pseudouridine synthase [Bacteroidetes bacterium HGW-Bacteroidetes-21]